MQVLKATAELQTTLKNWRDRGDKIAFVPTMGGLHEGHLSLIQLAKKTADRAVVSVFVNPAQFAENEDFATYPRDLEQDLSLLKACQVDGVFAPSIDEIYPNGVDNTFDIGVMGQILCGKTRPHFFSGVVQVVQRLFDIIKPDIAVFGQKDYQQLHIIKQFTSGVEILSGEIVREENGLAISTRNQYLSLAQRKIAAQLYKILTQLSNAELSKEQAKEALKQYFELDYLVMLDADTLEKIDTTTTQVAILCAVFLGLTRLIDNIIFSCQSKAV